jgi:hypothetical protein
MHVTLVVEGDGEGGQAVEHHYKTVVVKHVDVDTVTRALSEMADVLAGLDNELAFPPLSTSSRSQRPRKRPKPKRKSRPRINIRVGDRERSR